MDARRWQLAIFVLLDFLVLTDAIERYATGAHPPHHAHHDQGHVQVDLDKRGISHMRREPELHEDPFHSIKHNHHKMGHPKRTPSLHKAEHPHRTMSHTGHAAMLLEDSPTGDVGPEAHPAEHDVEVAQSNEAQEIRNAQADSGNPTIPINNLEQAETEVEKIDEVVEASEEKAGLEDSTVTTPEPQLTEPTEEDEEFTALEIGGISIVVLIAVATAFVCIHMVRNRKPKADAALTEGEGEEAEGEGEAEEVAGES